MIFRELTHNQSTFLLYSINKTLEDSRNLDAEMTAFYEHTAQILREKLLGTEHAAEE